MSVTLTPISNRALYLEVTTRKNCDGKQQPNSLVSSTEQDNMLHRSTNCLFLSDFFASWRTCHLTSLDTTAVGCQRVTTFCHFDEISPPDFILPWAFQLLKFNMHRSTAYYAGADDSVWFRNQAVDDVGYN
jgi:hypothetical protein